LPSHDATGTSLGQVSLTRRAWAALGAAFLVITALLVITTATLISQREHTDLLNRQIGSLLRQTGFVTARAAPTLDALPTQSSTVASRADAAAALVARSRPLIDALNASNLPAAVRAGSRLLQSIDQPGMLAGTLTDVDALVVGALRAGSAVGRSGLLGRTLRGLRDLDELVALQRRSLAVQAATHLTAHRTGVLTAHTLATAQRTLAIATRILSVAEQTLVHVASLDRKVGTVP
jgi:hypothetical protein